MISVLLITLNVLFSFVSSFCLGGALVLIDDEVKTLESSIGSKISGIDLNDRISPVRRTRALGFAIISAFALFLVLLTAIALRFVR